MNKHKIDYYSYYCEKCGASFSQIVKGERLVCSDNVIGINHILFRKKVNPIIDYIAGQLGIMG